VVNQQLNGLHSTSCIFVQVASITFAERNKMRLFKKKKDRKYKITYDKERNHYYMIYEGFPFHLNEEEYVFDEGMSWEEASKYSHDLNTEIGLTIYYET
jgi:hypothetical protein